MAGKLKQHQQQKKKIGQQKKPQHEMRRAGPARDRSVGKVNTAKPKQQPRGRLSADGAKWMITALNPYSDGPLTMAGYPDLDASLTTVVQRDFVLEMKAPGVGAWAAHIAFLPFMRPTGGVFGQFDIPGNKITALSMVTPFSMGMITAVAMTQDDVPVHPMWPDSAAWAPPNPLSVNYINTSTLTNTNMRVIAAALEVEDTSPVLSKSGALIAYRQGTHATHTVPRVVSAIAGATGDGPMPVVRMHKPPSLPSDASQMSSSVEWEAPKGLYMPLVQSSVENPILGLQNNPVIFASKLDAVTAASGMMTNFSPGLNATSSLIGSVNQTIPFEQAGVFLTNLDPKSTFKIRLRLVMERAPTCEDLDELGRATPSPLYDPAAFAAYSQAIRHMPIAMEFKANSIGTWLKSILRVLGPGIVMGLGKVADIGLGALGKVFGGL